MKERDSVAAYFLEAMMHSVMADRQRTEGILKASGIDPVLISDPTAKVPAKAFATLWLNQIRNLGDEFFGLDSRGMPLGSFALICRSLIQERTLHKALRQCLKNFSLFLKDFRGTLTVVEDRASISLETNARNEVVWRLGEETFLILVVSLMCWLTGRRIPIVRAEFRSVRMTLADDTMLWGNNVKFGCRRTEIEFNSSYLKLPVVQNLESLKAFLQTAPQWLVIRFRNDESIGILVLKKLRETDYRNWPTLHDFAVGQNMSASTFRRRLDREGHSYQDIKDQVRSAMAIDLLCSSAKSVGEISDLIGFQEVSAFHRAFKKWTGMSPGYFRDAYPHANFNRN